MSLEWGGVELFGQHLSKKDSCMMEVRTLHEKKADCLIKSLQEKCEF